MLDTGDGFESPAGLQQLPRDGDLLPARGDEPQAHKDESFVSAVTRPGWPLSIRGQRGSVQTESRRAPFRGNPLNEAGFLPGHKTASSASQPAETFGPNPQPREAQTQTTYDREGEDANHEPDHGSEEEGSRIRSKPEHDANTHAGSPQEHEEGPPGGDADNRPLVRFCPTNTCESHAHPAR